MNNTFKLRNGNIEVRPCNVESKYDYEVVKWSKNPFYGKKDEYRTINPFGEEVFSKNGINYSESIFDNPESCYVVSFIYWNNHEPCWEVNEVGVRPFELNGKDSNDWYKLMKMIFNNDILPKRAK